MSRRYCPPCHDMKRTEVIRHGEKRIRVCRGCGNAVLHDDYGDYLKAELRRYERMVACRESENHDGSTGHLYRGPHGRCVDCGAVKDRAPESQVDQAALRALSEHTE